MLTPQSLDMKVAGVVLVYVCILADPAKCSWNQQFGNNYSSSYIDVPSTIPFAAGASQTFKNYYSLDYNSYDPAVSEHGVLFLPLTQTGVGVSVVAIDTAGEVIWNVGINGPDTCGQSSNVVYSQRFGLVLIACGESYSNSTPILYSIFALSESNGEVKWSKQDLPVGKNSKLLALSDDTNTLVYIAEGEEKNSACVLYLSLSDGALASSSNYSLCDTQWPGHMQTKIGYYVDDRDDVQEVLITSSFSENAIVAFDFSFGLAKTPLWKTQLPTNPNVYTHLFLSYASAEDFEHTVFVTASFVPWETNHKGGYYVFGLGTDAKGSVVYNKTGYCDNSSAIISPPAVNNDVIAFFSCGNQVFAIYPYGALIWKSEKLTATYQAGVPPLPVSLNNSKGLLYVVVGPTTVAVLKMKSGDLVRTKFFELPKAAQIVHPPIILGDVGLYIIYRTGQEDISVLLWSGL